MAFDGKLLSGVTVLIAVVEGRDHRESCRSARAIPLRREPSADAPRAARGRAAPGTNHPVTFIDG
jgi:hypothetical protein